MNDFENMVAIVVGAADNIGRATAVMLAKRGAKVVLGYHSNKTGADEGRAEIEALGGQAIVVQLDHSKEEEVVALVEKAISEFGKINVLISNSAGTSAEFQKRDLDVVRMNAAHWDAAMATNLRGPMLTCKHTIPHMIKAGYGSIVLTGSGVVWRGDTVRTAYSASKIGLHSLAMDIATSYGKQNVRCNVVAPGLVLTSLVKRILDQDSINKLAAQNLVPFVGESDDIAHVSCFIASPAARYLTGQVIAVDGGMFVPQAVVGQI